MTVDGDDGGGGGGADGGTGDNGKDDDGGGGDDDEDVGTGGGGGGSDLAKKPVSKETTRPLTVPGEVTTISKCASKSRSCACSSAEK